MSRDLRDDNQQAAFTEDAVDDFVNFGISEVNRIHPSQTIEDVDVVDTSGEWQGRPRVCRGHELGQPRRSVAWGGFQDTDSTRMEEYSDSGFDFWARDAHPSELHEPWTRPLTPSDCSAIRIEPVLQERLGRV